MLSTLIPAMYSAGGMVGRGDEVGTLDRLLNRQDRGGGRVVAISGEPGIGKSRLLSELSTRAEESRRLVLEGRATEFERGVPFAVFVDALDDYLGSWHPRRLEALGAERRAELARVFPALGEFAEPPGLDAERYRLHRAVRSLLELLAADQPFVLLLDDVHWADAASLELLIHLLRHPPKSASLLAVAYRPAQVQPELSNQLAAAHGDGEATLISLDPLTREETAELLGSDVAVETLETLFVQSGGNPFFALQLARSPLADQGTDAPGEASEGVPRAVIAAIERELATLTESGRHLLAGAAVAGDPFEPELAGAAGGIEDALTLGLLDELLSSDLVRPTAVPTRFRFRHPVVRRAIYEATGRGWRLTAHRRAEEFLRARGATAVELAHHVEAAAQPGDRAAVGLLAEAGRAVADRAPRIAARRFEAARRLLPANDPARLHLLVPLATSLGAAGDLEASYGALQDALSLLPPEQSPTRVQLVAFCAAIEHLLGRHEQAHARLLREQEALPPGNSPAAVALALELSTDGQWMSDFEGMARWGERALIGARAVGSRSLEAAAEVLVCFAYSILGPIAEAERHRVVAGDLIDSLSDAELAERLQTSFWLGPAEYLLERYEDGARHLGRGIAVARATGQGQFLTEMKSIQAWCLTALGRLEEASAVIEEALDGARLARSVQATSVALWVRCWLGATIGDLELGLRSGEESIAIASELDENISLWVARAHLAAVYVEVGEYERAVHELELAGAPDLDRFGIERKPFWCEVLARACLGLGRIDEAEQWVVRAEEFSEGHDLPVAVAAAQRARARFLLAREQPAQAATLALAAAAGQLSRGVSVDAARSRVLAGRALAAAGEGERALAELECAWEELDALGARRWRDEAARELRRLGRRVTRRGRRGAGSGIASLSGRELEVAGLVAAGNTNKEIAARLFLSEKTVEKHLARVFDKLAVSGRRAVAARLADKREAPTT